MKEKYKYKVSCSNCGASYTETQEYGLHRPILMVCKTCGCSANTTTYTEKSLYDYKSNQHKLL